MYITYGVRPVDACECFTYLLRFLNGRCVLPLSPHNLAACISCQIIIVLVHAQVWEQLPGALYSNSLTKQWPACGCVGARSTRGKNCFCVHGTELVATPDCAHDVWVLPQALHSELAATQAAAAAAIVAADGTEQDPAAALCAVRRALHHVESCASGAEYSRVLLPHELQPATASTDNSVARSPAPGSAAAAAEDWGGLTAGRQLAAAVEEQLQQWESVVASHQSASRVLKWACGPPAPPGSGI